MRSVGVAVVVLLMVLQTTALSETTTVPSTPTITSCLIQPCTPYCGWSIGAPGSDECLYCGCQTTCENYSYCAEDEECIMKEAHCYLEKCVFVPTCVPRIDTTETSIRTTTNCPTMVTCMLSCDWTIDSDGCQSCDCRPTCERVTCGPGERCVLINGNDCSTCYYCVSETTTETTTVPPTPIPTITSCLIHPCVPNCGWSTAKPGSDECQYCGCQTTCENYSECAEDEECIMTEAHCYLEQCVFVPNCVPRIVTTSDTTLETTRRRCPIVTCGPNCAPSSTPDPEGCPGCDCYPNCWDTPCGPGLQCVFQFVCPPCFPVATCIPDDTTLITTSTPTDTTAIIPTRHPCPMPLCLRECVPTQEPNGCTICVCSNYTCQNVNCDPGYVCELQVVQCFTTPCFPQPTCVPVQDPCTGTPNPQRCKSRKYRWTYNSVTDTCERFSYYGCTPSPNTFSSKKACKNRCQGGPPPICADVACADDCYTFTKRNQCPKCICPNPCEGIRCRKGYECKLRETECDEAPEPFCARIHCDS